MSLRRRGCRRRICLAYPIANVTCLHKMRKLKALVINGKRIGIKISKRRTWNGNRYIPLCVTCVVGVLPNFESGRLTWFYRRRVVSKKRLIPRLQVGIPMSVIDAQSNLTFNGIIVGNHR